MKKPTQAQIVPPFEIYHDGMCIADKNGHICTAENPEIAKAILADLIAAAEVRPKSIQEKLRVQKVSDPNVVLEGTSGGFDIFRKLVRNDTIERCAQVAKDFLYEHYGSSFDAIAENLVAAIRALKDKP